MKNHLLLVESYLYNLLFSPSIIDTRSGFDLALTSHSSRVSRAFAAIESVCSGPVKPRRVILFLSDEELSRPLPSPLARLASRGLEILRCEDVGPHTKLQPYLALHEHFTHPLVTIDDDVFYDRGLLRGLASAWAAQPEIIHCSRARKIMLRGSGFAPYASWPLCGDDEPSSSNFVTGVGGVIYPPGFLSALKIAGDGYRQVCPMADDIWINKQALRAGIRVRQMKSAPAKLLDVPGARRTARFKKNLRLGENDIQLRHSYTTREIGSIALSAVFERSFSNDSVHQTCREDRLVEASIAPQ